jgi:hypothetical protein
MEITGRTEDIHGNHTGYFCVELPLRELFAAFALAGIAKLDLAFVSEPVRRAFEYADAAVTISEGQQQ